MPAPRSGSPRARRSGPPPGRLRMPSICAYDTSKRGWLDARRQEGGIRPPTAGLAAPAIGSFVRLGCRQNYLARSAKASRFPIRPSSKQQRKRPNPMLRHPSLRRRIVLPFIVLVVFVGAVGIAVVSAQVGGSVEGAVDNSLVRSSLRSNDRLAGVENDRLQQLRAATNTAGIDAGVVLLGQSLAEIAQAITGSSSVAVGFYDLSGTSLASSLAGSPSLSSEVRREVTPDAPVRVATQWDSRPYRLLVNDWTMRGVQLGYLGAGVPADDLSGSLNAIRFVLVALFGAIALGTILIGLVLADRITRPIDQLVASMQVVSAGDYSRRVQGESPDENGYLARTFHGMTPALQAEIRARDEAYFRNLEKLARAIDARDPYTFEHSARVAAISLELAEGLHLSEADLVVLRRAGLLHDVGKIGVSDKILSKPGPLNDEEWDAIRRHPVIGFDMLKDVPFLQPSLDPIRHHHERWDGEGYPDGLKGASISQLARVVTLADAFDAMTSDRPYRKGFSFEFAARTIMSEAGRQFDPAVVEAFKAKKAAIFARLEEMGKRPTPHASDIRLDSVA